MAQSEGEYVSKYLIVDLDGTLACDKHRNHLLQEKPRLWDAYFALCDKDQVHDDIRYIVNMFETMGHHIVIITGRCESVRRKTVEWLDKHDIGFDSLLMRPVGDRTDDHELKLGIAKRIGLTPNRVLAVLEDRQRVVDAWRAAGYRCLQVAPGNF